MGDDERDVALEEAKVLRLSLLDLQGASAPDCAWIMAAQLNGLSKAGMLPSIPSDAMTDVFMQSNERVRLMVVMNWTIRLAVEIRGRRTDWANRMILWDRLDCYPATTENRAKFPEWSEEWWLGITTGAAVMNYASEHEFDSALSVAQANCPKREHPRHDEFWLAMLSMVEYTSEHVWIDPSSPLGHPHGLDRMVTTYVSRCEDPLLLCGAALTGDDE